MSMAEGVSALLGRMSLRAGVGGEGGGGVVEGELEEKCFVAVLSRRPVEGPGGCRRVMAQTRFN